MFTEADYVIANFETPMAGEEAVYTDSYYVFNSPDSYADALKAAGIDFVSTANNHVFDHGVKFAVVAYTYATYYEDDPKDPRSVLVTDEYEGTVNLLRDQRESVYLPGVWRGDDWIKRFLRLFS